MTKTIRVENADNSTFKVVVEVWDIPFQPAGDDPKPHILVRTIPLDHPCAMTPPDVYLTSNRYLVVKEVG